MLLIGLQGSAIYFTSGSRRVGIKVQNNAGRLVLRVSATDHISPRLASVHWLPIDSRIQDKLSLLSAIIASTRLLLLLD